MKRFLIEILIGVTIFCALWGVCEQLFIKINVRNDYSYKYAYVKNNEAVNTLFIGHSHFECGINPYLMDSAFNYAISGRGWLYWDLALAKDYIPTMENLQTIIFPLGYVMPYESPTYCRLDEVEKDKIYRYHHFMRVSYKDYPQYYVYCSALLRNKMGLKYWRNEPIDSLGFDRRVGMSSVFEESADFNPLIFQGDTAFLSYQEYRSYLIELAKICHENNIRFIVVTPPCADSYLANTREQGVRNLYDLIDSVSVYYPVEYYNYLNDSEFRSDSLYYNCSHLNADGADLLARRLMRNK